MPVVILSNQSGRTHICLLTFELSWMSNIEPRMSNNILFEYGRICEDNNDPKFLSLLVIFQVGRASEPFIVRISYTQIQWQSKPIRFAIDQKWLSRLLGDIQFGIRRSHPIYKVNKGWTIVECAKWLRSRDKNVAKKFALIKWNNEKESIFCWCNEWIECQFIFISGMTVPYLAWPLLAAITFNNILRLPSSVQHRLSYQMALIPL